MASTSAQAWTFGKGTRGDLARGKCPGPGQYSIGGRSGGPAFSVAKGGRDGPAGKDRRPGPGQYALKSSFGTQGKTMAGRNGKGFMGNGSITPGPGQYAPKERPKTAGGAFGVKTGSSLIVNPQTGARVGPGSYNLGRGNSSKNVKANVGFGTNKADRGVGTANRAPGPGMYNTRGNMDIENGHIFGTSTRKDARDLMLNPGPGQYNAGSSIGQGGVTMKSRTSFGEFLPSKHGPGPGQYNPDGRSGNKGSKFGTGGRSDFVGSGAQTPGPGQHNIDSVSNKGSCFGPHNTNNKFDRSKGLVSNADNPGPGQYSYGQGGNGPAFSMGSKLGDKNDNWQPAPGTYQPDISSIKGDAKGSRFGGGNRSNIASGKQGPGPGAYNVNYRNTDANNYSIGGSKRQGDRNHGVPGPGSYHLPYHVAEVPRYQMPNKPDEWRFV